MIYVFSGVKQSNVNVAEGQKQARILTSEAYMSEQINQAKGEYMSKGEAFLCWILKL